MSKTPEDYKNLFSQINSKLESTDPDDIKTVATAEFKEVAESLLFEFQTQAPEKPSVTDPNDEMNRIFKDYPMTGRFKACDFDESAMRGAWQALGIASAIPGPRQQMWEVQTDAIVDSAPKVLLDLVFRAYSGALTDDQRKSLVARKNSEKSHVVNIPMATVTMDELSALPLQRLPAAKIDQSDLVGFPMLETLKARLESSDLAAYPVRTVKPGDTYTIPVDDTARLDIDEIIEKMKESPAVRQAILDIAKDMTHDSNARKHRTKDADEGPGF